MSFIQNDTSATVYAPGFFLAADELCVRETREIPASLGTTVGTTKYVKAGTFFPANNSGTVEGIVYEDVDVTTGAMPGSVVTSGTVYLDRLPASPESGVQNALEGKGFKFITAVPPVVRPQFPTSLIELTVNSSAGTAVGDTAITYSGYTPKSDEGLVYKVATGTAPAIKAGEIPDNTWTAWNGTDDITAASEKKITVAVINAAGEAIAAGNATVTAKANG